MLEMQLPLETSVAMCYFFALLVEKLQYIYLPTNQAVLEQTCPKDFWCTMVFPSSYQLKVSRDAAHICT